MDNVKGIEGEADPAYLWNRGIDLFNEQEFFECHEVLEDLWNLQEEPDKQLTQGVLQIAVGYLHIGRSNPVGAIKLFRRGLARIQPFPDGSAGIAITPLFRAVSSALLDLEKGMPTSGFEPPTIQRQCTTSNSITSAVDS